MRADGSAKTVAPLLRRKRSPSAACLSDFEILRRTLSMSDPIFFWHILDSRFSRLRLGILLHASVDGFSQATQGFELAAKVRF